SAGLVGVPVNRNRLLASELQQLLVHSGQFRNVLKRLTFIAVHELALEVQDRAAATDETVPRAPLSGVETERGGIVVVKRAGRGVLICMSAAPYLTEAGFKVAQHLIRGQLI